VPIVRYRPAVVPLAVLAAVAIAGCSTGGPHAAAPAQGGSSAARAPAAATPAVRDANAGRSLSAVDPCSLGAQVTPIIDLTKVKAGSPDGTRGCTWHASALDADLTGTDYTLSVYIFDHDGLPREDVPPPGETITKYAGLAGHQTRLVKNAGTEACTVSIAVTSSSRVDVVVYASALAADCAAATEAAPAVAGQLPGGQPGSSGAQPVAANAPSGPLAAVDPCSLGAQDRAGLTKVKSGRGFCEWVSGSPKSVPSSQFEAVEADFVYSSGLDGIVHDPDVTIAAFPSVAGHPASLATIPPLNSCVISLGVTSSSRVDVGVDDYLGSAAAACQLARKVAPVLARKLPAAG
jgi:hypothetical protein